MQRALGMAGSRVRNAASSLPSLLLQGISVLNCGGDEADGQRRGECVHSLGKALTIVSQGGKQVVDQGYGAVLAPDPAISQNKGSP